MPQAEFVSGALADVMLPAFAELRVDGTKSKNAAKAKTTRRAKSSQACAWTGGDNVPKPHMPKSGNFSFKDAEEELAGAWKNSMGADKDTKWWARAPTMWKAAGKILGVPEKYRGQVMMQAVESLIAWRSTITSKMGQRLRVAMAKEWESDLSREFHLDDRSPPTAQETALAKTIYADTQAYLKAKGRKTLNLYRGIGGEAAADIAAQLRAGATSVRISMNVLSSYTEDATAASSFAESPIDVEAGRYGAVIRVEVPRDRVFAGENFGEVWSEGQEWVVITRTGEITVRASDIQVVENDELDKSLMRAAKSVVRVDADLQNANWIKSAMAMAI